jgi:hypothetical protein
MQKPPDDVAPDGKLRAIVRELHKAIDEVWGGMFQKSVRLEQDRQKLARERLHSSRGPEHTER